MMSRQITLSLLLLAVSAFAIRDGFVDETAQYNNIGIQQIDLGPHGIDYCTVSLISERLALGTGHCGIGTMLFVNGSTKVSFLSPAGEIFRNASSLTNPYFDDLVNWGAFFASGGLGVGNPYYQGRGKEDVSLIVFDEPVLNITPSVVAPVGYLNSIALGPQTPTTTVGYGMTAVGIPVDGLRRYADGKFQTLNADFVKVNTAAGQGLGGTCYSDSGAPVFLGTNDDDFNVQTGIIVTGDQGCMGSDSALRVDTYTVHCFIQVVEDAVANGYQFPDGTYLYDCAFHSIYEGNTLSCPLRKYLDLCLE